MLSERNVRMASTLSFLTFLTNITKRLLIPFFNKDMHPILPKNNTGVFALEILNNSNNFLIGDFFQKNLSFKKNETDDKITDDYGHYIFLNESYPPGCVTIDESYPPGCVTIDESYPSNV